MCAVGIRMECSKSWELDLDGDSIWGGTGMGIWVGTYADDGIPMWSLWKIVLVT